MRRPSKWGEKTEKTTDRLPSTRDLRQYLQWCGGVDVQDLNFPAWGGGLLATQPAVNSGLERKRQASRQKVFGGHIVSQQ